MKPIGQHIRLRLCNDAVIARTPEQRLRVARSVLERDAAFGVLSFGLADTHLHMAATRDEPTCKELARRVEASITLGLQLQVGFAPPHLRSIEDHDHLRRAFIYDLRQLKRHGLLHIDPTGLGTNIQDLLGFRLLGKHTRRQMEAWLPRMRQRTILECLDLEALPEGQPPLDCLGEAAAAAAALPDLRGRSEQTLRARRAAAEVGAGQLGWTKLATMLKTSASALGRLRKRPADPELVAAIRGQLRLRWAITAKRQPAEHRR